MGGMDKIQLSSCRTACILPLMVAFFGLFKIRGFFYHLLTSFFLPKIYLRLFLALQTLFADFSNLFGKLQFWEEDLERFKKL